jgi:hypothetical protein
MTITLRMGGGSNIGATAQIEELAAAGVAVTTHFTGQAR